MNAERLLAHFEQISEAPDAITRLRRFILDLAVRGKLVEQDPEDEPAEELLRIIEMEKARLGIKAARKRYTRCKAGTNGLFAVPPGWTSVSGFEIFPTRSGNSKLIKGKLYHEPGENLYPGFSAAGQDVWLDTWEHEGEAIILSAVGARCGKAFLASGKWSAIANTHIVWMLPWVTLPGFAMLWLNNEAFWIRSGGAQPFVKVGETLEKSFPLPPLAEQHRIVAKVDELMALCDQLEAARQERQQGRERLMAATLQRLNQPAEDPASFRQDASFALQVLPSLTTTLAQIKQLRQTILNLAVRGKLVEQDPEDEPAEELSRQISLERKWLVKTGAIPNKKPAVRDPARLMRDLPINWDQVALGDLCNLVTSGSRGWAEYYSETGVGFIRAQNIRFGRLLLGDIACVQLPPNCEGARTRVEQSDLFVVITGAGVTNPALLDQDVGEAYVSQHVGLIRPTDKSLSLWLLLCLMAPAGGRDELFQRAYGSGKPGLNLDNIRSLTIPLPPLAEQHRIVAKVDELMALCDQLEQQLSQADQQRRRLLEAVLAEALQSSKPALGSESRV
jgi:type I restriction enzyme S subunit